MKKKNKKKDFYFLYIYIDTIRAGKERIIADYGSKRSSIKDL